MAESNNKEIFYVLLGVGITLLAVVAVYSFLTNRKVERMSWQAERGIQQPMQGLSAPVVSSQPVVYDEKIYRILADNEQNIHNHIEDLNSNINSLNNNLNSNLKSLNYKIPSLGINNNIPRAGSVNTVRTTVEDKVRQKDFGMN